MCRPIVVPTSSEGAPRVVIRLRRITTYRDVAQVVARVVRDHEAAGSSPVIPSNAAYSQGECAARRAFSDEVGTIIGESHYEGF